MEAGVGAFGWIGPVILLISALLTAGYLLPITLKGFFPGRAVAAEKNQEPALTMLVPVAILAILAVILGLFPNLLVSFFSQIAGTVM